MKTRPVDPINNADDHLCLVQGVMGKSSHYISGETGLSQGQIRYRLNKFEIKLSDYRNGDNRFTKVVFRQARRAVDAELMKHLRSKLQ